MIKGLLLGGLCLPLLSLVAQPQADHEFNFPIQHPQYALEKGPKVFIDGAHHNYHTYEGGFSPFAKLLAQDGYQVQASNQSFDDDLLNQCQILVIANPLNEDDLQSWIKPNPPAFTETEVEAVKTWVKAGGSLLLIADHMPFPGAVSNLAEAFGFQFSNGFAMPIEQQFPTSIFDRTTGSLHDNDITNGQLPGQKIDQIATFTGSAFQSPENATPILSFAQDHTSIEPDTAWRFHPHTPRINLKDWHQGAYLPYGKGRIVVYGEAAMLTAQMAQGKFKVGFNHPKARQNAQLVLNTIHWLDQSQKLKVKTRTKALLSVEELDFSSAVLKEERKVYINLPKSYESSEKDYPLLLVLDADYRFSVTSGIIDYINYWNGLPEIISVGIPNIDRTVRNRDLLPNSYGGEADDFLKFISEEVLPYVEENYRVSNQKVLIGHSHGGVFTVYTMLTKPDLFDAYIATDPSISGLIPFTEEKLAQSYAEKRFYLSSSDIGPGVDPQIVQDHLGGLQVFQQLIKNKNPQGLQWKFSHIADDHGNAYVQSASEGLRFAFSKK